MLCFYETIHELQKKTGASVTLESNSCCCISLFSSLSAFWSRKHARAKEYELRDKSNNPKLTVPPQCNGVTDQTASLQLEWFEHFSTFFLKLRLKGILQWTKSQIPVKPEAVSVHLDVCSSSLRLTVLYCLCQRNVWADKLCLLPRTTFIIQRDGS